MNAAFISGTALGLALLGRPANAEDDFRIRPVVALRAGPIVTGGELSTYEDQTETISRAVGGGYALEVDAGLRISPCWTVQGIYEGAIYDATKGNDRIVGNPWSHFVGVGFHADTSPHHSFGAIFELAAGYRWLGFRDDFRTSYYDAPAVKYFTYYGFDPLRVAVGPRVTLSKIVSLELTGHAAVGGFAGRHTDLCDDKDVDLCHWSIGGPHFFAGISLGGRLEL